MAGRVAAAAAREKCSFAVTCSLLSQYLKEKKGGLHRLGNLDLAAMAPPAAQVVFRPPTTMNLLSALDAPAGEPNDAAKARTEPRPSDCVGLSLQKATTQLPELVAPTDQQNGGNLRDAAGAQEAQQLTIFYGGKVVVFDNFPPTKVKGLLEMVQSGDDEDKASSNNAAPLNLPTTSHILSDLPIARRNSLHRFLEKRKGRITAKAPYQVNSSVEASKQATGEKSWLGLGQDVSVEQEI